MTGAGNAPDCGTLSIRPAVEADLDAITHIYAHAVERGVATYELVPPTAAVMAARFADLVTDGFPYLVAVAGDAVAGYAYAGPFRQRPAYRWLVEDSIYLDPAVQGKGVGLRLLSALVEACEHNGYRQVLAVIGGTHPASVALHRKLGFVTCGRIVASGFKFGRWLDTELMQLALGEGATTLPDESVYPGTLYRG